jgi:ribosomal-protein-alanine N-acetyltransferase
VTISTEPWSSPATSSPRVQLVQIPVEQIHALAEGDARRVLSANGGVLTPYLRGAECRSLWNYRSAQVRSTPSDAAWVTRLIVATGVASVTGAVGVAGFHGPPDEREMVEVGYRVDPQYRRRGYARSALETLLATARDHPAVSVVRASVSPDNAASRSLISQYGFVEVGEQWDEEDGLEILFEVSAV